MEISILILSKLNKILEKIKNFKIDFNIIIWINNFKELSILTFKSSQGNYKILKITND